MLLLDIIEKMHILLAQREIFEKGPKIHIFVLQQSFLYIFGVAQNFQLNGEGLMAQKGGGGDAPPLATALLGMVWFDVLKKIGLYLVPELRYPWFSLVWFGLMSS